ncbi:MAG: YkgJ family cysteine cluster protein [Candidatus Micrarchaeales archaeon]
MTIIGNKSKLANSEICQRCAKCCKEYTLYDTLDSALRFGWMLDDTITTGDTPFTSEDGLEMKQITFKKECAKLCTKDGKYYCSVWDKERPDFCANTPDNLFEGVEKWNREKIQEISGMNIAAFSK